MNKPVIGLTPGHNTDSQDVFLRPTYLKALTAAGAIPVMLPLELSEKDHDQIAQMFDGFVFTGGPDTHPLLFGEETHSQCGNISPKRDTLELALLSRVMAAQKPILGICRGIQIINVGLGGTIYQDISSQFAKESDGKTKFPLAHQQPYGYDIPSHTVRLDPDSRLARVCGCGHLNVNSIHHQAVKDPAPVLTVCGTASDGLIEALEMRGYPWLVAVQWHPEYLWEQDAAAALLFKDFVNACRTAY